MAVHSMAVKAGWFDSVLFFFFFSSRRRHTRSLCDWSSDVCSSDLHALRDGDLEEAREIARLGREVEGGPAGELRYLSAFLDRLENGGEQGEGSDSPAGAAGVRSEERRVGKGCRSRWASGP